MNWHAPGQITQSMCHASVGEDFVEWSGVQCGSSACVVCACQDVAGWLAASIQHCRLAAERPKVPTQIMKHGCRVESWIDQGYCCGAF